VQLDGEIQLEAQSADDEAKLVTNWILNEKPDQNDTQLMHPAARSYYLCLSQFKVVNGVLYYEWIDDLGTRSLRLFVPKSLRRKIMVDCHDPPSSGHQVERRTIDRVKRNYYWYGLTTDVLHYIANCVLCGMSKKYSRKKRAPFQLYA
jgi:hypothetical protein